MAEKKIAEIIEQVAIYDGKPDFMPVGMLIQALNFNSIGGWTTKDLDRHVESGEFVNPKRFKTRIIVEFEEL